MKFPLFTVAAVGLATLPLRAAQPVVYTWSAGNVATARARLAAHDAALQPAFDRLRAEADAALKFAPVAVTDKQRLPPSGDRHDYYSQSPYWWPDPARPDGLPFVARDGQTYPPSKQDTDSDNLWKLSQHTETLALAYFHTGRSDYAAHAARLVRAWFLDPATRMNPNLRYAQVIPGRSEVRGTGLIDARFLPNICNALGLLRGSAAWTADDDRAFDRWLAEYYTWLTTSEQGQAEHAAANNHGVWYLAQAAGIAARLNRLDEVRRFCTEAAARVDRQIEADGAQPLELGRTRSLHYSMFTLEAFFQLAVLGETAGVDLWGHVGPQGRSLRAALAYLAPYADPAKPWPKDDVHAAPRTRLLPLIALARGHWNDVAFADALRHFGSVGDEAGARWHLLANQPAP